MNEMIERVGDALRVACLKEFGTNWCHDVAWDFARAALSAAREPIEPMIKAVEERIRKDEGEHAIADGVAEWMWQAMIDAALAE